MGCFIIRALVPKSIKEHHGSERPRKEEKKHQRKRAGLALANSRIHVYSQIKETTPST